MRGLHIKTKRQKLNKPDKRKYTLHKLKELSCETRLIESHNSQTETKQDKGLNCF